jgi:hypothetical protein
MCEWDEIEAYLIAHHAGARRDREGLVLPRAGGRRLFVWIGDAGDRRRLIVVAPVCAEHRIDPALALRQGQDLALGSLVILGQKLVVRAFLPLEALKIEDLDEALAVMAYDADRVARLVAPPRDHALLH